MLGSILKEITIQVAYHPNSVRNGFYTIWAMQFFLLQLNVGKSKRVN